jgi:energy-coupling factor transporter ATP-binding protein EcfA2
MRIVLLRGHSGAGKTTYARSLIKALPEYQKGIICSADNYFMSKDGKYNFDYKKLDLAHRDCFCRFWTSIVTSGKYDLVIVDNTNTRLYELSPYIMAAKVNMEAGDTLEIKRFECSVSLAADRNVHCVPRGSIENMKKRTESLPGFWPEEELIYTNKV